MAHPKISYSGPHPMAGSATDLQRNDAADFPRGGSTSSSSLPPIEIKRIHLMAKKDSKQKRKKTASFSDQEEPDLADRAPRRLTFSRVAPGLLLLGYADSAAPADDRLHQTIKLPNGLIGHLQAPFAPEKRAVIVVVTRVDSADGKKKIICSREESLVSDAMNCSEKALQLESRLLVTVSSKEDRGFLCSSASTSRKLFLADKDAAAPVQVGDQIVASVAQISSRSIRLQWDGSTDARSSKLVTSDWSLLLPGDLVCGKVVGSYHFGYSISLQGCGDCAAEGTCDWKHAAAAAALDVGWEGEFRVIFVDPLGKRLGLSRLPWLLGAGGLEAIPIAVGSIHSATVLRADGTIGLLLQLPGGIGFAPTAQLPDPQPPTGSECRVRVVDVNCYDAVATVSALPAVLEEKLFCASDLSPGQVVRGTIAAVSDRGVVVLISQWLRAFSPKLFASDSAASYASRYLVGRAMQWLVVEVGGRAGGTRVTVSGKRSLITSEKARISRLEHATPGVVSHGVVVAVREFGFVVSFLGGLSGFLPKRLLSQEEKISEGQTLLVKVESVRDNGNLVLSLPTGSLTAAPVPEGTVVDGTVTRVDGRFGLFLSIRFKEAPQALHTGRVHLTDISDEYVDDPIAPFSIGQSVRGMLLEPVKDAANRVGEISVSLRPSRLSPDTAVKVKDPEISDASQLQGSVVRGFIVGIADRAGVFVSVGRNLSARIQIRNLSERFVSNWREIVRVGQVVRCRVLEVTAEGRLELAIQGQSEGEASLWDASEDALNEGDCVDGVLSNATKAGWFVRLREYPATVGLLHSNFLPPEAAAPQIGSALSVWIRRIDRERKRLALSLEPAAESAPAPPPQKQKLQERPAAAAATVVAEPATVSLERSAFNWSVTAAETAKEPSEGEDVALPFSKFCDSFLEHDPLASVDCNAAPEDSLARDCLDRPNEALPYVRLMHRHHQGGRIDDARSVAKQALQRIALRETSERQTIWLALLAIESEANSERLDAALAEARRSCDEKSLLLAFARILQRQGKPQETVAIWRTLQKRFPESSKVWTLFALYRFTTGAPDDARGLLQEALKRLPQRKHIKVQLRFALLERKYASAEISRTLFESLVATHPSRFDLCVAYLQSEKDPQRKFSLLERLVMRGWSVQKHRFLYKAWLGCARDQPRPEEAIQKVKRAAQEYVASVTSQ